MSIEIEDLGGVKLLKPKTSKFRSQKELNKIIFKSDNLDNYIEITNDLINYCDELFEDYQKLNQIKNKFNSYFQKVGKRKSKLKIDKIIINEVYTHMVKEKIIQENENFQSMIKSCATRSNSGTNSFAVLLSPYPNGQTFSCKHNCYFCSEQPDMPRSYLKEEPAVARGAANNWDPIKQVYNRFYSLTKQGHTLDKVEFIIEGGTFTEYPESYLVDYIRDLFYACNSYYYPTKPKKSLEEEKIFNTYESKIKLIGNCIETRPDAINDDWIILFRRLGVTRIQLGVQHTDNIILKKLNRGHTFQETIDAFKKLKDNGFKLDAQIMPDLPFSSPQKDKEMFDIIFKSNAINPDGVKNYPCQVVPYTEIEKWYKNGKYRPYAETNTTEFHNIMKYSMEITHESVRIARVVRDFDFKDHVIGGNKYSNLRQIISKDIDCRDIRSREANRHPDYIYDKTCYIDVQYAGDYNQHFFIQMISADRKVLFGFVRLSIPTPESKPVFKSLEGMGLIREIHVNNPVVKVGSKNNNQFKSQHRGIGKKLMKKAEEIAYQHNCKGVSVISGEGVRLYYRKLGYQEKETYETKYFIIKKEDYDFLGIIWALIIYLIFIYITAKYLIFYY